jgi:hypothetical protein
MYRALRFHENPIIHYELDDQIGANINGPSLIRVPSWVSRPLGRYYLYFAHHQGTFIRMAYADSVHGPWTVHRGGVLRRDETCCRGHIASPDVHVRPKQREITMYFHGPTEEGQRSFRASSVDGLHFQASAESLGPFYFRVFQHAGAWFAIARRDADQWTQTSAHQPSHQRTDDIGGGVLLRSSDGIKAFERGPNILPRLRHMAVLKKVDCLHLFYSRGEDNPECILLSTMRLKGDWKDWRPSDPVEILRPEREYEGGKLPVRPSRFGAIHEPARELRDPAVYEENGLLFLLYTGAGETAICGAELVLKKSGQSKGECNRA